MKKTMRIDDELCAVSTNWLRIFPLLFLFINCWIPFLHLSEWNFLPEMQKNFDFVILVIVLVFCFFLVREWYWHSLMFKLLYFKYSRIFQFPKKGIFLWYCGFFPAPKLCPMFETNCCWSDYIICYYHNNAMLWNSNTFHWSHQWRWWCE